MRVDVCFWHKADIDLTPKAESLAAPVSGNELIGNVIEVVADDLRLRADSQQIIANTLNQHSFPARSDGTQRVPSMTGDETEL